MNTQNTIPNLGKACRVLERVADVPGGLTAAELAAGAGLSRTTAFRILTTFCAEGFLAKAGNRFTAGGRLVRAGLRALGAMDLRERAVPVLQELATAAGATAHLGVLSGEASLIVEVCDSPHPVRVASRPGTLADLHASATGKAMLAHLPAVERDALLRRLALTRRTANTHTRRSSLAADLAAIARNGYAVDDEEYFDGVRCLAAPVFDAVGRPAAALGITAAVRSFPKKRIPAVARLVKDAARRLCMNSPTTRENPP